jgi:hypothetical protein
MDALILLLGGVTLMLLVGWATHRSGTPARDWTIAEYGASKVDLAGHPTLQQLATLQGFLAHDHIAQLHREAEEDALRRAALASYKEWHAAGSADGSTGAPTEATVTPPAEGRLHESPGLGRLMAVGPGAAVGGGPGRSQPERDVCLLVVGAVRLRECPAPGRGSPRAVGHRRGGRRRAR